MERLERVEPHVEPRDRSILCTRGVFAMAYAWDCWALQVAQGHRARK